MKPQAVKLNKEGQLTIPLQIRETLNLSETSQLSVVIDGNQILLTVIPEDQAWFWTKEWQEGEREADEDIKNGNIKCFNTAEEAIKYLHAKD